MEEYNLTNMIDLTFIREHPDLVKKAAADKNYTVDIEHLLEIDAKHRELTTEVQRLREERNKASKLRDIEKGKQLKEESEKKEHALQALAEELYDWLQRIPNLANSDVKVGKNEKENDAVRTFKEPTKFDFTPKDHLELGEALDIIDVKRASKVSGARFGYLKNEGVLLEFALVLLALETLIQEGFTPVIPPVLIKPEITQGLGYWQAGGSKDYYLVPEPDEGEGYYLVGTAEHSLVPMHKDEIFKKDELPKRYVGFSSAFRREAGSYGKDTKGILRVHQFDKVEMVSFTTVENDDKEHEYLLSLEEKLFQMLDIPYQVIKMCTGDLGFPIARKYDIEAWMPGQQKYREVTSASTATDFQSRRLNIKYLDGNDKKYVRILNGTAFAIGRTIIAIMENNQQKDGSIKVPEVLQKYVGKKIISQ